MQRCTVSRIRCLKHRIIQKMRPDVTRSKQILIERAMAFPMDDVLKKYCKEESVSHEAAVEHAREMKRFLILCAINPDVRYEMRCCVDKLWHVFILFTSKYTHFCDDIAGYYIHHEPDIDKEQYWSDNDEDYIKFLQDYERTFNESPSRLFWPRPTPPDLKNIPCCYMPGPCRFPGKQ
jgi:hypothetical protein